MFADQAVGRISWVTSHRMEKRQPLQPNAGLLQNSRFGRNRVANMMRFPQHIMRACATCHARHVGYTCEITLPGILVMVVSGMVVSTAKVKWTRPMDVQLYQASSKQDNEEIRR